MGKKNKTKQNADFRISKPRRITGGLTDHEHPAISPDGRFIAFYAGKYGAIQIYVTDLSGRFVRRISPLGGNNTQPAWHPGSQMLAFRHQHSPDSKWELWQTSLFDDAEPQQYLADPQWNYKHPSYSPDGSRIACFSDEGTADRFGLWLIDVQSGERTRLTDVVDRNDCHPVFSPDGARLSFHAYEETSANHEPPFTNLFELDLTDSSIRRLTGLRDQIKHPFYLNNNTITFHREDNASGVRRIGLLNLVSLERGYLTDGRDNDKHPYPWTGSGGRQYVAWASKKLGTELEGEGNTYDIFIAEIKGGWSRKGKGSDDKKAGQRARDLIKKKQGKCKPKKKVCKTCASPLVREGMITSWDQAEEHGVKGRKKACKKCPARIVLD